MSVDQNLKQNDVISMKYSDIKHSRERRSSQLALLQNQSSINITQSKESNLNNTINNSVGETTFIDPHDITEYKNKKRSPIYSVFEMFDENSPANVKPIISHYLTNVIRTDDNYLVTIDKIDMYSFIPSLFLDGECQAFDTLNLDMGHKRFIIQESNNFQKQWNIFIFFMMSMLLMQMPLQISEPDMSDSSSIMQLDLFIDMIFMFDMMLNFFFSTTDANGMILDNHSVIALNQVSGWFWVDFLSSVPISFIMQAISKGGDIDHIDEELLSNTNLIAKLPRQQKFMKLAKLIRIFKALKYQNLLNELLALLSISSTHLDVLFKSIVLLIFCHIMSCFWVFMLSQNPNPTWWTSFAADQGLDESSLTAKQSIAWQYIFQTVTTVGQGDVPGMSPDEISFKIVCIFAGVQLWSFIMASITQIQLEFVIDHMQDRNIKQKIDTINTKYSLTINSMVNLDMLLSSTTNFSLREDFNLINKLPPRMADEVLDEVKAFFDIRINFFKNIKKEMFVKILQAMHLKYQTENELLWQAYRPADKVQMIGSGQVSQTTDTLERYSISVLGIFQIVEMGDVIGLDCAQGAYLNEETQYSCRADEQCEVQQMNKIDFIDLNQQQDSVDWIYDTIKSNFQVQHSASIATLFILHLMLLNNLYVDEHNILTLVKKYKVLTILSNQNTNENQKDLKNNVEAIIQYLNLIVKYQVGEIINLTKLDFNLFSNGFTDQWWDQFLTNPKYNTIIWDLTSKYISGSYKLKRLEKFLLEKNPNVLKLQVEQQKQYGFLSKMEALNNQNEQKNQTVSDDVKKMSYDDTHDNSKKQVFSKNSVRMNKFNDSDQEQNDNYSIINNNYNYNNNLDSNHDHEFLSNGHKKQNNEDIVNKIPYSDSETEIVLNHIAMQLSDLSDGQINMEKQKEMVKMQNTNKLMSKFSIIKKTVSEKDEDYEDDNSLEQGGEISIRSHLSANNASSYNLNSSNNNSIQINSEHNNGVYEVDHDPQQNGEVNDNINLKLKCPDKQNMSKIKKKNGY